VTRLLAVLAVVAALAGCDAVDAALAPIDETADHPVPEGLAHPESWVYLPPPSNRHADQTTRWVKPEAPEGTPPGKPGERPRYRGKWTEAFEYRTLERPQRPPRDYAETFKQRMERNCPDVTVTPLRISESELLLEVVTHGCEPFGTEDELLRMVFDKPDFVQLGYTVKAAAMTPAQRESGLKAIYAWKFKS
jgi:hypothetical protein